MCASLTIWLPQSKILVLIPLGTQSSITDAVTTRLWSSKTTLLTLSVDTELLYSGMQQSLTIPSVLKLLSLLLTKIDLLALFLTKQLIMLYSQT
jgi:hypothetical protein